jgi:hypothetical protein
MFVIWKSSNVALYVGIITLVIMPMALRGQTSAQDSARKDQQPTRTYTAPGLPTKQKAAEKKEGNRTEVRSTEDADKIVANIPPRIEIVEVKAGNPENIAPGFYAAFTPKAYDTIFIYEGGSEQYEIIDVSAQREVISGDSVSVAQEVSFRMNHLDDKGIPVDNQKHAKTNTIVIRSGFIPSQGFGTQRFRFAIKPGNFVLSPNSMISASVHLSQGEDIGTILCTITSIDYKKGVFYIETSNEIPKGEKINWIIVNTP